MRKAVYAGSFDPLTNGHLWMIRESAALVDELIVALGVNPTKKYAYSLERRLAILRECVAELANVRVVSCSGQFLADFARAEDARYLLRGIRSESDYEYERGMRYVNEDLNATLTTLFLIPPRSMVEVSSSMVKGLIGSIGWEQAIKRYVPQPAYRTILEHALAGRFARTWAAAGGRHPERVFHELAVKYSEPHRHYHTLEHVASCLSELDRLDEDPATRNAIELAVWFHDVVYDIAEKTSEGKTSERRSADLFRRVAEESGLSAPIEEVVTMIMATERHAVPEGKDSEALALFLDIDLSILGADADRFLEYDIAIRKEYSSIADAIYYPARARVLSFFLEKPALYLTQTFRQRYEAQARKNLTTALATRHGGQPVGRPISQDQVRR